MQVIGDLFNALFLAPIINLLVLILRILQAINIPGALGFAIIILTVIIRVIIWPFMATQLKSAKKMADLKPHLDELKKKHGKDKQSFAKAQMDLYKEHGVNPAGGCLPSIIQIPIILALYQVILSLFDKSGLEKINHFLYTNSWHINTPPDPQFFGVSLADKPSDFAKIGVLILLIPIITAVLQFIQSKMMVTSPPKIKKTDTLKEKEEKIETEDTMAAVQSQMMYMMPIMIGYFAFSFPVGIAIYWNTFTVLGIIQQHKISGWGGMENLIKNLKFKI